MTPKPTYEELLQRVQRLEQEARKLKEAEVSLRLTEQYANAAINSLTANIAILDKNGVILETNQSWQNFALENGLTSSPDTVGLNYLGICDSAEGEPAEVAKAHEVAAGIRAVIAGELDEFLTDYESHSPAEKRWFYMRVTRLAGQEPLRVVVSHENVTPLKLAEEALKEREQELELQRQKLEETNTALRVLLKAREEDKRDLEDKVLANVKELVNPYIEKLNNSGLDARQKAYLEIVESNLNDIISPFLHQLSSKYLSLTPREIQVAGLVREGKTTKEIAEILSISTNAVDFHRKNVREKLGLKNKSANLRTHLLSLGQ
ncbi:MAG: helix-turn-helix transcriptional regulator [Deltaproteobacteria bacterium]|jgi:DNA-binding CsgD family transcriptional regulator/PAS domain-containing protein|nr:MAG: helix-turn-helix transcriptional regulator [Deltaproteobacteria bacterium]